MRSKKKTPAGPYPLASILALVAPSLIQFIWMSCASETISFSERKSDFLSYFPVYFQNHLTINSIAAGLSLLAVVLGFVGIKGGNLASKIICGISIVVGLALAAFAIIRIYE